MWVGVGPTMHQEKFEEILENTTTFIIHTIRMVKVKQTSDMWCVVVEGHFDRVYYIVLECCAGRGTI